MLKPSKTTGRAYPALKRFYVNGQSLRGQAAAQFLFSRDPDERYDGLRDYIFLTWPQYSQEIIVDADGWRVIPSESWNPWLERMLRGFVNEQYCVRRGDSVFRFIGLTGVGAASKTFATGLFALAWWTISPSNSIAINTSTTKEQIRNRIWSNIASHWRSMADLQTGVSISHFFHCLDSQMKLYLEGGESKMGIHAFAVARGETLKAIDNLKGMHAERMLVIIDEANGTPEAILQVIANYRKGCRDMTVIAIGNPSQHLDPHGRLCKPSVGWSITADDQQIEWLTEGVPDWQIDPGLCLRFDGRDSPNVKLGRNKFGYLYSIDNWHEAQSNFERHGGTFNYWTQDRGMWPPDGFSNSVFTEQLFIRCDALDSHFTFLRNRTPYAFLDTAFGGDACILHFAEVGETEGGLFCMQLTDVVEVPIDPASLGQDRDYQIARWVIEECKLRRIDPENVGTDATGTGRGVAAIISSEWSPKVHYIVWSTGTTERPSSQSDARPAREVYSNFVTEAWYAVRDGLEAGQIKGFSNEAVSQLSSRLFSPKGKKLALETKEEMRNRLRFSPDIADAIAGLWEIARRNGLSVKGRIAEISSSSWREEQRRAQEELSALNPATTTIATNDGGWAELSISGGWD